MQFSTDRINPEPHTCLATLAHLRAPKSCLPGLSLNERPPLLLIQSISTKRTKQRFAWCAETELRNCIDHYYRFLICVHRIQPCAQPLCITDKTLTPSDNDRKWVSEASRPREFTGEQNVDMNKDSRDKLYDKPALKSTTIRKRSEWGREVGGRGEHLDHLLFIAIQFPKSGCLFWFSEDRKYSYWNVYSALASLQLLFT